MLKLVQVTIFIIQNLKLHIQKIVTTSETKGNGFGMLVGAEMLHPVTNNLAIKANAGYKLLTNIKNLKDQNGNEIEDVSISMNGLKLGFGVIYSF
jgi:hypothetical protein